MVENILKRLMLLIAVLSALFVTTLGAQAANCTTSNGYTAIGSQCVLIFDIVPAKYEEANSLCFQFNQGHLIRFDNVDQFSEIIRHLQEKNNSKDYWIGGHYSNNSWVYGTANDYSNVPKGTPYWATEEEINSIGISTWTQEPNGEFHENDKTGIILQSSYFYFMTPYTETEKEVTAYPICEVAPDVFRGQQIDTIDEELLSADIETLVSEGQVEEYDTECPLSYLEIEDRCYSLVLWADLTQAEAEVTCQSIHGHLAYFENAFDFRALILYLKAQGIDYDSFWVGGKKTEAGWIWDYTKQNLTLGPPFWGTRGENEIDPLDKEDLDCVAMKAEGFHYFRSVKCSELLKPLCMTSKTSEANN